MTHLRLHDYVVALALASALLLGCSDSPTNGTTTTSAPATTTVPASADIDVELLEFGGFLSGQGNLFQVTIRITESGGVGAHINFARLEIFRATGELEERREIGAGQLIEGLGDNELDANSTEAIVLTFFFNATGKSGRTLLLTMGFTDDSGNDHESMDEFVIG
jgi:hypothetical protein